MNRTPKISRLTELLRGSVILSFLKLLADYLYRAASHSLIGTLLTSYRADRNKTERTLTYRLLNSRRFSVKNRILLPCKRFCNRTLKESLLLASICRGMRYLFDLPVQFYGTVLFSFGLYTTALELLLQYGFQLQGFAAHDTVINLLIAGVTAPLLFSRQPLSESLGSSAFMHFLLCTVLGYRPQSFTAVSRPKSRTGVALILGVLLSLLTVRIPITSVLLAVSFFVIAYLILLTPETGVILIFFSIPFLKTMHLALLILFTILSFCIKLAQGKRSIAFELQDYTVLSFLCLLLIGGFCSFSPADSLAPALLMACLMGTYFLVISTVRSTAMVKRCIGVILCAVGIESVIGVLEAAIGNPGTQWQDMRLFASMGGRIVGTLQNPNVLGVYLILCIPFLPALFTMSKKAAPRFGILLLIGVTGSALVLTWSRGAWLGILLALLVYFIFCSRKTLVALFLGALTLPLTIGLLPETVLQRFASIGNLADSSIAYRINLWKGSLAMAEEHWLGGIGTGINTFRAVYPQYSLEGIETAPHSHNLFLQILLEHGVLGLLLFLAIVFLFLQSSFSYLRSRWEASEHPMLLFTLAGICSLLAFLAQGMTDYVWYNYRIFAFFWMLLGLISACRRCGIKERTEYTDDDIYGACAEFN